MKDDSCSVDDRFESGRNDPSDRTFATIDHFTRLKRDSLCNFDPGTVELGANDSSEKDRSDLFWLQLSQHGRNGRQSPITSLARQNLWGFGLGPRYAHGDRVDSLPEMKRGSAMPSPLAWSGREDSNLRPQRPERCALTGLRYSPRAHAEDSTDEPNDNKIAMHQ